MKVGITYLCEITPRVMNLVRELRSGDRGLKGEEGFEIEQLLESTEFGLELYRAVGIIDGVRFTTPTLKTGLDIPGMGYKVSGSISIEDKHCRLEDIVFAEEAGLYVMSDDDGKLYCGIIAEKKGASNGEQI